MKLILLGLAAFVLSLSATTGVMVLRAKAAPAVAPAQVAAKADSVATHPDSTHQKPAKTEVRAPADSVKSPADSGRRGTRTDTAKADTVSASLGRPATPNAAAGTTSELVSATAAVHSPDPKARALAYKQLARIFSAMKPVEAAKVLGLLSDMEVEGILRAVGPRQAADFLTNLSKERAAALSRRLLAPAADAEAAK
jgi:hypothetical protein